QAFATRTTGSSQSRAPSACSVEIGAGGGAAHEELVMCALLTRSCELMQFWRDGGRDEAKGLLSCRSIEAVQHPVVSSHIDARSPCTLEFDVLGVPTTGMQPLSMASQVAGAAYGYWFGRDHIAEHRGAFAE